MRTPAILVSSVALLLASESVRVAPVAHAQAEPRPRVIVSTDIGGTDPDDFQSMVHFLVYADMFDVEGLISSPYGPGRREHILQVIDHYAADYANLRTLLRRAIPRPTSCGASRSKARIDSAGSSGRGPPDGRIGLDRPLPRGATTRGRSRCSSGAASTTSPRRCTTRPTSCRSSASTSSAGRTRCGASTPTTTSSSITRRSGSIEANATYRGWFTGGNQTGEWGNKAFVAAHIAGRGALGDFFATQLEGTIKMGDSPSVGYLLHGTPDDPSQPGWGGKFVRIWDGRKTVFDRLTTEADKAEAFGVVEFALPAPAGMTAAQSARMIFDGRIPAVGNARRRRAAIPLLAARRQSVAVRDSQRLSRPRRPVGLVHRRAAAGRANQPRVHRASQLVD